MSWRMLHDKISELIYIRKINFRIELRPDIGWMLDSVQKDIEYLKIWLNIQRMVSIVYRNYSDENFG